MTIFEKIIQRLIPSKILDESEDWIVIQDIAPQAPVHFLVIPKKRIARLDEATTEDQLLIGNLLLVASRVAKQEGLKDTGYRVILNNGQDAGETVPHLHIHVLGGRYMAWPPG